MQVVDIKATQTGILEVKLNNNGNIHRKTYIPTVAIESIEYEEVQTKAKEVFTKEVIDRWNKENKKVPIDYVNVSKKLLQNLCDKKSVEAKTFIAGKKVTVEQLSRYEEKYQMATEFKANGNYADTLKLEADLQGLTVDELADLILASGNAYKQALIVFNARIEAFRVAVSKIIDAGDIDRANTIIKSAESFDATTTDEDVAGLFG